MSNFLRFKEVVPIEKSLKSRAIPSNYIGKSSNRLGQIDLLNHASKQ